MSGQTNATLGPTLFGAEILRQLAGARSSVELRWIAQDKAYILHFAAGAPAGYVAPSGTASRDPETVRKVLRAFAISVEGFVQLAPHSFDAALGIDTLGIDTLGEALVAVLHGMPERGVVQILESRSGRYYVAGPRYDAVANAIMASRGPVLPKPSAPVALGTVTRSVSIEARRAWLALIALGAVEQTRAPEPKPAPTAAPAPAASSAPRPQRTASVSQVMGAQPRPATNQQKAAEPASEAHAKAHLLRLQLPKDPDAVHAALDLKKRLTAMFDKTHYEVLGIPRTASQETIRNAYFELAKTYHLDRFSNVPLGEYRQVADEVFRKISEASRVLSDDKERSNYDVYLDRKAKGLPTDVNVILEADNLFQRGKMMVDRGQGANAYNDLARAFELADQDLDYKTYYAYAKYLAMGSSSFEETRDALHEVIKKEPKHGKAHDFLGRIYRAEGNLKGAASHLQKAIELSPRNADAQRELRVVQMRLNKQTDDGKGGFLKGLLKR